ncbi:hypothetical protein ACHAQA_007301 [Verticillium albo-atrum]
MVDDGVATALLLLDHSNGSLTETELEAYSGTSNNTPLNAFKVPATAPCDSSHKARQQSFIQPKRRGRPPKVWPTQGKGTDLKKIARVTQSGSNSPNLSINVSLVSPTNQRPDGSENKTSLRARNRAAAYKCRIRKQREMEDLEAQGTNLGAVNESLKHQHAKLRDEVLMLRDMVLQHGNCGCSFIESYIQDVAVNLLHKPKAFTTSQQGPSSTPVSPAASLLRATVQELGTRGGSLSPLDEESDSGECFDWNMTCLAMDSHFDERQMLDTGGEIEGDVIG